MHGGMAEEGEKGEERSSEYCQRVNFLVILPLEDNYMRPLYYPSVVMHDQRDYFQKQWHGYTYLCFMSQTNLFPLLTYCFLCHDHLILSNCWGQLDAGESPFLCTVSFPVPEQGGQPHLDPSLALPLPSHRAAPFLPSHRPASHSFPSHLPLIHLVFLSPLNIVRIVSAWTNLWCQPTFSKAPFSLKRCTYIILESKLATWTVGCTKIPKSFQNLMLFWYILYWYVWKPFLQKKWFFLHFPSLAAILKKMARAQGKMR